MINHVFAACLMMAAQTYSVPPQVLVGILHVEGGHIGQQVRNTNGSYDLGPMQINSLWVPELASNWKVSQKTAWKWLRDDGCTNINVAAWILGQHLVETKSLAKAVAHYHSRTPRLGAKYKSKVVDVMRRKGLLAKPSSAPGTPAQPARNTIGKTAMTERTRDNSGTTIERIKAKRFKLERNNSMVSNNVSEDKG